MTQTTTYLTEQEVNNLPTSEHDKYVFDGDASVYRGYRVYRRKKEFGGNDE